MGKPFVCVFVAVASLATMTVPAFAKTVHAGDIAPEIVLPSDRLGETIDLAHFRGAAVYIDIFTSWCYPSIQEAPAVQKLFMKYRERGFVSIGVDERENGAHARAIADTYGWTFPVGIDNDVLSRAYGIDGLPTHIFIDRRGKIALVQAGTMSPREIEAEIEKII